MIGKLRRGEKNQTNTIRRKLCDETQERIYDDGDKK
jgi:hypothetical protein